MVWEPGDEAWETKLAALRSYRRAHGHMAPRQDAVWGEGNNELVPIGQLMANVRRKGGLGKDAERPEERAEQLTAIDEDWNCPWPLDWQRHHRVLADLVDADGVLPEIQPGVLFEGDDLGRWRQRQASNWAQLSTEQPRTGQQMFQELLAGPGHDCLGRSPDRAGIRISGRNNQTPDDQHEHRTVVPIGNTLALAIRQKHQHETRNRCQQHDTSRHHPDQGQHHPGATDTSTPKKHRQTDAHHQSSTRTGLPWAPASC